MSSVSRVSRDPIMLRKASEAIPEGNEPVPQKEELGSGQPTMEDVYQQPLVA